MKCKYCGAEIANDSVYCEQCGKFTNPFNKKGVTCSMSLVKWLLFGTMAVSMILSLHVTWSLLVWFPILVSLVIFVVSFVLSKKKMLSWGFTIFTFLFFSAALVGFILVLCSPTMFVTALMFWIEAGILLLCVIYEIIAGSIARKRIRRG